MIILLYICCWWGADTFFLLNQLSKFLKIYLKLLIYISGISVVQA